MRMKEESKNAVLKLNTQKKDHCIWFHHFTTNSWRNNGNSDRLYFLVFQNHCRWWLQPWIKRHLLPGRKDMINLDSALKNRDITSPINVHLVWTKRYCFSSSHVQVWELDHKEGWAPMNRCFRIVALEKTLEHPLNSKEIKPVNPIGNQP